MNILLFTDNTGLSSSPQLDHFVGYKVPGSTVTIDAVALRTAASAESEIAAAVAAGSYDVCVLLVGTNDDDTDAKALAQQIRKTAKKGKTSSTGVVICATLGENGAAVTAQLNRLNNNPSYAIVDIRDAFFTEGYDDNDGGFDASAPDENWPNSDGIDKIADAIAGAL